LQGGFNITFAVLATHANAKIRSLDIAFSSKNTPLLQDAT